jgi:hypothetical protein
MQSRRVDTEMCLAIRSNQLAIGKDYNILSYAAVAQLEAKLAEVNAKLLQPCRYKSEKPAENRRIPLKFVQTHAR